MKLSQGNQLSTIILYYIILYYIILYYIILYYIIVYYIYYIILYYILHYLHYLHISSLFSTVTQRLTLTLISRTSRESSRALEEEEYLAHCHPHLVRMILDFSRRSVPRPREED